MNEDLRTREYCLEILLSVLYKEEQSHVFLKKVLDKNDDWEPSRKAFLKKLTMGVLERKEELSFVLSQFMKKGSKVKPVIQTILLMGAYQILYMDKVSDTKACNLSVELAKKKGFVNLAGFVNGVLRSLSRGKESIVYPDAAKDPAGYLQAKYSLPAWMGELFTSAYGMEKTKEICEYFLKDSGLSVHVKESLSDKEKGDLLKAWEEKGITVTPCKYLPSAYRLNGAGDVSLLYGYDEGLFHVQDFSAQLAGCLTPVREGDTVMDICASPGGKSLYVAERAGKVYSFDVSEGKTERIKENAARMRFDNIICEVRDASVKQPDLEGKADVLIADVPCSGLGVIGRKPDLKNRLKEEDLGEIVKLQKQIVTAAASDIKEGGYLLYSTCTVNPGENEGMADWIKANLPFEEVSFERFPEELKEARISDGRVRILPGEYDGDGFFIALFRKCGE
jgi:16S rRNA (cytosine967-C5)-methyltransferase